MFVESLCRSWFLIKAMFFKPVAFVRLINLACSMTLAGLLTYDGPMDKKRIYNKIR
jgi:hypothetical protein